MSTPSQPTMRVTAEISPGEAADKRTILAIKQDRIANPAMLAHIDREAALLDAALAPLLAAEPSLAAHMADLRAVNERLWTIEDEIRDHERRGDFGPGFVALARAVYLTNDLRAGLKGRINRLLRSDIAEQKSYAAVAG
jgi:hypothetical protein